MLQQHLVQSISQGEETKKDGVKVKVKVKVIVCNNNNNNNGGRVQESVGSSFLNNTE